MKGKNGETKKKTKKKGTLGRMVLVGSEPIAYSFARLTLWALLATVCIIDWILHIKVKVY